MGFSERSKAAQMLPVAVYDLFFCAEASFQIGVLFKVSLDFLFISGHVREIERPRRLW